MTILFILFSSQFILSNFLLPMCAFFIIQIWLIGDHLLVIFTSEAPDFGIFTIKLVSVIKREQNNLLQILSGPHFKPFIIKCSVGLLCLESGLSCVFPQILFVLVNVDEHRNGRLMEYFRVRHFDAPHIRLVNLTDQITYQMLCETLDVESIKQFCQSYLEGKAKVNHTQICILAWSYVPWLLRVYVL